MAEEVLPHCVPETIRGEVFAYGCWWVPVYCAVCHDGPKGYVTRASIEAKCFAFYLCDPPKDCGTKYGELAGITKIPDDVYAEKVRDAQTEKYGRILSYNETVEQHMDGNSMLSKLARERQLWRRK